MLDAESTHCLVQTSRDSSTDFSETPVQNFTKIHPAGAEFSHAAVRIGTQTHDETKSRKSRV
jgi:hypothetical protein